MGICQPGVSSGSPALQSYDFLAHSRLIKQNPPFVSLRLLSTVEDELLSSTFRSRLQLNFWCILKRNTPHFGTARLPCAPWTGAWLDEGL